MFFFLECMVQMGGRSDMLFLWQEPYHGQFAPSFLLSLFPMSHWNLDYYSLGTELPISLQVLRDRAGAY